MAPSDMMLSAPLSPALSLGERSRCASDASHRSMDGFFLEPLMIKAMDAHGTPFFLTAISIAKVIVGAGILSLSWAFYLGSLWPGLICAVVMCCFSAHSFIMLGFCADLTEGAGYSEIWSEAYGFDKGWVTELTLAIYCTMSTLSYLIIIGDYFPRGLAGVGFTWAPMQNRRVAITAVSVAIIPLNFAKDLSCLGYTSIIGTFGVLYTTAVLFMHAYSNKDHFAEIQQFDVGPRVFLMIPAVTFAFTGHYNAPDLYRQLANPTPRRWVGVTSLAFTFILAITVLCGVSGYLMFGSELGLNGRSNILTAPEFQGMRDIEAAYMATTFSLVFGLPFLHKGCTDAWFALYVRYLGAYDELDTTGEKRRSAVMLFCIAGTLTLSMFITDLGYVVSITGAACATLIMFVFPSLMYLRIVAPLKKPRTCFQRLKIRWMPYISIVVGVLVGTAGVSTSVCQMLGVTI